MRVKWSRKALLNLDYAVEYIAADNPTAASEVAQRIWDISQMIADQPGIGRKNFDRVSYCRLYHYI